MPDEIKGTDAVSASTDADSLFYLLKITERGEIGNRDPDGSVKEFFDIEDIGVIQSTALLQDFNADEFIEIPGQANDKWVNGDGSWGGLNGFSLLVPEFPLSVPGGTMMPKLEATWIAGATDADTELNAALAIKTAYEGLNVESSTFADPTIGFVAADLFTYAEGNTTLGLTPSVMWTMYGSKIKDLLKSSIPDLTSATKASDIITVLDAIIGGKSFTFQPGSNFKFVDASSSNVIEALNNFYGPNTSIQKDLINDPTSLKDFSTVKDFVETQIDRTTNFFGNVFNSPTFWNEYKALTNTTNLTTGVAQNFLLIQQITGQLSTGLSFTGLSDTPTGYDDGKILQSTTTGLKWVDMPAGGGDIASYSSVEALPTAPTRGTLAIVGCDLYIACDGGEWQRVLKDGEQEPIAANAQVPSCVTSVNDQIIYNDYRTAFVAANEADVFQRAFDGNPQVEIHEVCIHSEDPRNIARINDLPDNIFKFGLFYGNTGVDITAVPRNANIKFEGWQSSTNQGVFGDPSSANTTLQVTESMDIFALFSGFITNDKVTLGSQIDPANAIAIKGNILAVGSWSQGRVAIWKIAENGDLTLIQNLDKGSNSNFGIAIALNEDGTKLAVSDYKQNAQAVFLYERQPDDTFLERNTIAKVPDPNFDHLGFSSGLSWGGNKLYCSTYQRFYFDVYDIDASFNETLEQTLFYDPDNELPSNLMFNTNWGFGHKINVKNNLAVVLGKHTVNILKHNTTTNQWEVVEDECFTFRDKLNLDINDGKTLTLEATPTYCLAVEIQDDNNIWVADSLNVAVNGMQNAGAIFQFTKQSDNTWLHTRTITSGNPTASTSFGNGIDIQGSQLLVVDTGQNEINIFNI